jgi:hypothetical protein
MEIVKNKQWRSLPTEVVHLIAEMTGCVKLRNGVLVPQISKDDPRRQVLENIPKIVLSSYQSGDNEVFVSAVRSTRHHYKYKNADYYDIVEFEIVSLFNLTSSPRRFITLDDTGYIFIDNIHKYITYSFNVDNPKWRRNGFENEELVIVKCDGTVIHVLDQY